MAKTDRYPSPRRAIPKNILHPTRTSQILTPRIVFGAVITLIAATISGIAIAASLPNPRTAGESVARVFALIACSISGLYLILHLIATVKNEPVGIIRPPVLRVHGYCFVTARLALVIWTITLIVSSVVVSKPNVCLRGTRVCNLLILDLVGASLAFLSMGILLTALESCPNPFRMPGFLHITRKVSYRVSSFGSEVFHDSKKTSARDEENVSDDFHKVKAMKLANLAEKPLPRRPSRKTTIPGEFPEENASSALAQQTGVRTWGEEWKHLVKDASASTVKMSDSLPSLSASSSITSVSDQSSGASVSKRGNLQHAVTPSSSISNKSRRSHLSTMRSIEFPNVPVPAQLRYLPPVMGPPNEWKYSNTAAPLTQLLPVAEKLDSQRRFSRVPTVLRPTSSMPIPPPKFAPKRRNTIDVKIPGAFVSSYHPSPDDQMRLDEHVRKIELESTRSRNVQKAKGLVILPGGEFEQHYVPYTADSRSKFCHHNRMQPSNTTALTMSTSADSAVFMDAVQVEYVKPLKSGRQVPETEKKGHFKLLSIGDVSPELGLIWDENMGG